MAHADHRAFIGTVRAARVRSMLVTGLTLSLAFVCSLLLFGCGCSKGDEKPAPTTVPDVVGMTQKDATAAIEDAGFELGDVKTTPDDKVKKGLVITQSPQAKTEAEAGSKVGIIVSSGPAANEEDDKDDLIDEPNVVGKPQDDAKATLEKAGFEVEVVQERSDTVEEGKVISQSPAAGSKLFKGEKITIVVSTGAGDDANDKQTDEQTDAPVIGAANVTVPYVANLTLDDAVYNMEQNGLGHTVEYAYSDTVAEGYTIGTNPAGGAVVSPGDTITIIVSEGSGGGGAPAADAASATVTVPYVVGTDEMSARLMLAQAGLGVYVEGRYDVAPASQVIAQTPAGWTEAEPGSYVTITVSEGPAPDGADYS